MQLVHAACVVGWVPQRPAPEHWTCALWLITSASYMALFIGLGFAAYVMICASVSTSTLWITCNTLSGVLRRDSGWVWDSG